MFEKPSGPFLKTT
jgi:hypothetical protein